MNRFMRLLTMVGVLLGTLLGTLQAPPAAHAQEGIEKIDHVIILYLENHTVDNLYSRLPGVNGVESPGGQVLQVDKDGVPYPVLPPVKVSLKYAGFGRPDRYPARVARSPLPERSAQRALPDRRLRPEQRPRQHAGSPFLRTPIADGRGADGQVRRLDRFGRPADGLLRHDEVAALS